MNLRNVLVNAMSTYAVEGENGYSYLTQSLEGDVMTVVYVSAMDGNTYVDTGLMVQIVNGKAIIMLDNNNKPLVDMLLQLGVPRDKIVLAYAGEKVEQLL